MEVDLLSSGTKHTLETVRVLHETVLALKTALEGSRKELTELRSRFHSQNEGQNIKKSMDNVTNNEEQEEEKDDKSEEGDEDVFEQKGDSESEDIDDIELVFTTGETDANAMHEDMVSIREEHPRKSLLHTVIVETDISKCGVEENDSILSSRRNTLPDPLPYRPIVHREILAASKLGARGSPCKVPPLRPVISDRSSARQETGAQTDITALPGQWKSETYLAHKISYNLTTLPSKFTLPVPRATHHHHHHQLPLHDKSREARRVLLSDINFTSMVPELSRSADHLHQEEEAVQGLIKNYPNAYDYMKKDGRSPRAERCCDFGRHGSRSSWGSYYGSRCQASSTSITPFVCEEPKRRHSWRPLTSNCCHNSHVWSSVPSSPSRSRCHLSHHRLHSQETFWSSANIPPKKSRSKVTFHHCNPNIHPGQSLPDLRLDMDSGESTDSLVDEAEEFLRHSIDSMIIAKGTARRRARRHSDPDLEFGFEPPKSAQPYLPKFPRDLKHNYLVKVITSEGRIVVGRVRYSGPVTGRSEPHVGVELPVDSGVSDGTFLGHRYFDCEPDHAIFVPFKKVVLAWST